MKTKYESQNTVSVLMSVYDGEKVSYFEEAMHSIWHALSLRPSQIVLVLDGKLRKQLQEAVDSWSNLLGKVLKVVALKENVGLGWALKEGLKHCSSEYIARMDTDDIALWDRFERQFRFLEQSLRVDVVGCFISEIDEYGQITRSKVEYPLQHDDMRSFFFNERPFTTCNSNVSDEFL